MAQSVEHVLGKDGVTSSNLVISSIKTDGFYTVCFFIRLTLGANKNPIANNTEKI